MKLPARYKISYHKRTGIWELPDECLPCERGTRPPKSTNERKQRGRLLRPKKRPKRKPTTDFRDIADGIEVEPRPTLDDVADYAHYIYPNGSNNEGNETRQVHLAHHIRDSSYSEVGQRIKGRGFEQTATAFGNNVDFKDFIVDLSSSMMSTDSLTVREQQQGSRIVRYTLLPGGHVEKTVLEPRGNGLYEAITSHDKITVAHVKDKFGKKI